MSVARVNLKMTGVPVDREWGPGAVMCRDGIIKNKLSFYLPWGLSVNGDCHLDTISCGGR